MAGHIALLHVDDLRVLVELSRPPLAEGRRGITSLYGVLVRAVYHALTILVLHAPGCPPDMPPHFPVGRCQSRGDWLSEPNVYGGHSPEDPFLSLGEAITIVQSFGRVTPRSPVHPRFVGGVLIVAPAYLLIRTPEATARDPAFFSLAKETWIPERFYGRSTSYWPMVCNAAQLWIESRYTIAPNSPNGCASAAFATYLMAMIAGQRHHTPPLVPPLSDAVRAIIRAEHLDGAVNLSKSLERARSWYRDVPRDVPQTTVEARPDPRDGPVPPRPAAAATHGTASGVTPSSPTSPPAPYISLPFVNGIQREAFVRASFSALANSMFTLRTSVDQASMAQPSGQTDGPAPSSVLALQTQMSLVVDALTELAVLSEVFDAQAP